MYAHAYAYTHMYTQHKKENYDEEKKALGKMNKDVAAMEKSIESKK
jgi:hypothetical protein